MNINLSKIRAFHNWCVKKGYAKKKIESLFSESENQTSIELQDTGLGEESTTDEVRRVREKIWLWWYIYRQP